ncbi:hypothetical protein, partial [Mesorhizobium sp. M0435]|uniref:hypothetical protein n=1 Tax=Mesorhizobium sp. M0435 TaxID=2956944 RepID=UPI00333DDC5C
MTDELPKFSRVELALGERVGKIAAPMINQGMALEEALTGAYPIAARQLIDAGEDAQEVEAALAELSGILCARPVSSLADEPFAEDDGELG